MTFEDILFYNFDNEERQVLLTFLEVNGIPLEATDEEVVDVGLRLAEGKMQYEELLQWIKDHE